MSALTSYDINVWYYLVRLRTFLYHLTPEALL